MVIILGRRNDPALRHRAGAGRPVGIACVVLLHACLIYFLVSALGILPAPRHETVTQLRPVQQPSTPNDPQPDPQVTFKLPLYVPPAIVPPTVVIGTSTAPTGSSAPPAQTAFVPVPAAPVLPRIDFARSTKPDYPAISRRMLEHGKVTVAVLVDEAGSVQDVRLDASSGFPRLDQAALDGVRRHYHFTPGSRDGKPEAMWQKVIVAFELTDPD